MLRMFRRLRDDRSGVTAIEYAILICLIGLTLVFALGEVGSSLGQTFASIDTQIQSTFAGSGGGHHDHDGH